MADELLAVDAAGVLGVLSPLLRKALRFSPFSLSRIHFAARLRVAEREHGPSCFAVECAALAFLLPPRRHLLALELRAHQHLDAGDDRHADVRHRG